MERYLVTLFEDYNFKQSQRIHKGFGQCSDTLESLFLKSNLFWSKKTRVETLVGENIA